MGIGSKPFLVVLCLYILVGAMIHVRHRLIADAKRILTEAIATDTRFLAAQSVMDYSLLLGLEKNKQELVVGIVDSIGSYDLWKTIESKGKMLTRGGDVTVVSFTYSSEI